MKVIQDDRPVWDREHNGLRWQDMPGSGADERKMNFYLWRVGRYDPRKDEQGWTRAQRTNNGFGRPSGVSPERAERTAVMRAKIAEARESGQSLDLIARAAGLLSVTLYAAVSKRNRPFTDRLLGKLEAVFGTATEVEAVGGCASE